MHFFNTILDSPYIIDKNEDVILKFQVEPINKQTYNFYLVRNKDNMYYLTYSIINVSYILNELRKNHTEEIKNKYNQMSSKDKSLYFEKLLNETSNNEDFQSYIKNNHCYTIDILDNTQISKIIDKIKNLDSQVTLLNKKVAIWREKAKEFMPKPVFQNTLSLVNSLSPIGLAKTVVRQVKNLVDKNS